MKIVYVAATLEEIEKVKSISESLSRMVKDIGGVASNIGEVIKKGEAEDEKKPRYTGPNTTAANSEVFKVDLPLKEEEEDDGERGTYDPSICGDCDGCSGQPRGGADDTTASSGGEGSESSKPTSLDKCDDCDYLLGGEACHNCHGYRNFKPRFKPRQDREGTAPVEPMQAKRIGGSEVPQCSDCGLHKRSMALWPCSDCRGLRKGSPDRSVKRGA